MSIAAIGYPAESRVGPTSGTSAIAQVAVRGNDTALDESLPITSQVPELDELQSAIDAFNGYIPMATNDLMFSIDEDNGKLVVKIVDTTTQDVIRQIPSEEALAISRSLEKLQGILLQGKA